MHTVAHRGELGLWSTAHPPVCTSSAVLYVYMYFPITPAKMVEGERLQGYTVNSVTEVPEFDLVAVQLTHDKTRAQHLHLARNDSNNTFGYVWILIQCTCT